MSADPVPAFAACAACSAQQRKQLVASLRPGVRTLLSAAEDPHAELLAMLWGSRFDREHAQQLMARQARAVHEAATRDDSARAARTLRELMQAVVTAAESFDNLPPDRQHRLRRIVVRHRALHGEHGGELHGGGHCGGVDGGVGGTAHGSVHREQGTAAAV
ncbi:hypothetical protein BH11PSE7_BH11PSE7_14390 [soil metagenome]